MKANIIYQTDQLARYFSQNRVAWEQFYDSEREIISQLNPKSSCDVLDIGCGCGGLGMALKEKFGVGNYTGVEINPLAVEVGQSINPKARLLCGDILDLRRGTIRGSQFEIVFSLSCIDWNVRFYDMLSEAWSFVRPGGFLIATFRLTADEGCDDFNKSYQYINYDGERKGERASYVVLNARALVQQLSSFDPSAINAFGYWGSPSPTAMTPYKELCFAAFSIQKRKVGDVGALRRHLNLPKAILNSLGSLEQ